MRPELMDLPEPNWFHHGELVLSLLEVYKPKVCVELGTYRGGSAIAQARVISRWGGMLTCFDRWDGDVTKDECLENLAKAGVAHVVRLVQAPTTDVARLLWPTMVDYLYVDAGHTYKECLADLETWWPLLKVDALVAGDDYDDPHGVPSAGVTAAWDAFEAEHRQQFWRAVSPELLGCRCDKCRAGRLIWGVKR